MSNLDLIKFMKLCTVCMHALRNIHILHITLAPWHNKGPFLKLYPLQHLVLCLQAVEICALCYLTCTVLC